MSGTPMDPREERFRPMGDFLFAEVIAVMIMALVAVIFGGQIGRGAAIGMFVLLLTIPMIRVLWLVIRWFRRGDPRFALVGLVVLAVPLVALVISH